MRPVMSRFDRLYRDNFPFVWAAAHRCGAPAGCVDDVVQDVFVTAYRRLEELHWEVSPRGWLYGVTRRVAFRYRRTAARSARRASAIAASGSRVDRPHGKHDAAHALHSLLESIEPAQREAFVMAELLGMSGPEIAGQLEVPLNTVYSRLRLARKRLTQIAGSEHALGAEVDATRDADTPTPDDRQRTYAALIPMIGSPWLPVATGLAGAAKTAAIPTVVLGVAIATWVATTAAPEPAPESVVDPIAAASTVADDDPATRQRSPASPRVPSEAAPAAQATTPAPAAIPDAAAPREASRRAAPTDTRPTAPDKVVETHAEADATAVEPPPIDGLSAEVALLDRAKAALARGEATAALAALDTHLQTFPAGQLADARGATRFRVLCGAGRLDEAEIAAQDLHRAHPQSALARQTPKNCPSP